MTPSLLSRGGFEDFSTQSGSYGTRIGASPKLRRPRLIEGRMVLRASPRGSDGVGRGVDEVGVDPFSVFPGRKGFTPLSYSSDPVKAPPPSLPVSGRTGPDLVGSRSSEARLRRDRGNRRVLSCPTPGRVKGGRGAGEGRARRVGINLGRRAS